MPTPIFNLHAVTEFDVAKTLKSISSNATGVDCINKHMLKLCIPYHIPALTHIINTSIQENKFPTKWKKALIIPVKKCCEPKTPSDYRPISILPTVSKIIEKLVSTQLVQYLNSNKLFNAFQSGFRQRHSTLTALLKVTDDIYQSFDRSNITLLILLDFSKAFDTVNHKLLLAKMKKMGIGNSTIDWFKSYLSDRYQKVVTSNGESQWSHIINGVPQGSILGPLLFTILVTDLPECVSAGNTHMYADDTQLYYHTSISNLSHTINTANSELCKIAEYCTNNCLKLNARKSMYMFIGTPRNISTMKRSDYPPVLINSMPITQQSSARNLGVTFDEVLSWRKHINNITNSAYNNLRLLYRFKKFLSIDSKRTLCESLILSKFNYCDILFTNLSVQLQYRLQKVQNSCIRFIFQLRKKDHARINNYLTKLKWLNIKNRQLLHSHLQVFKIIHNLSPEYLSFDTVSNVHQHNTRQSDQLYVSTRRTSRSSHSFMSRAPLWYNCLPNDVKSCNSINTFKQKCKHYLLSLQAAQ